jgi:hypothetical protein
MNLVGRRGKVLRIACYFALLAIALMCWAVLDPRPLPVVIAMSVGQAIGTVSLGVYIVVVFVEIRNERQERANSLRPPPEEHTLRKSTLLRNHYGLDSFILTGDCGQITPAQIQLLRGRSGIQWIAAWKHHKVRDLLGYQSVQLGLVDTQYQVRTLTIKTKDKIGVRVGKVLNKYKVGKHFKV